MTGVEKHYIERDLIKYFRKYMESDDQKLPLHSVHKKRNQTFAFLNFISEEQKTLFKDLFHSNMISQIQSKRINLRECNNYK